MLNLLLSEFYLFTFQIPCNKKFLLSNIANLFFFP